MLQKTGEILGSGSLLTFSSPTSDATAVVASSVRAPQRRKRDLASPQQDDERDDRGDDDIDSGRVAAAGRPDWRSLRR
jgi:hypothetical protein